MPDRSVAGLAPKRKRGRDLDSLTGNCHPKHSAKLQSRRTPANDSMFPGDAAPPTRKPEACQRVAGGHGAAKTPGTPRMTREAPRRACQTFARGTSSGVRNDFPTGEPGFRSAQPPATLCQTLRVGAIGWTPRIGAVPATFCPEGTYDNSPAFQRWVQGLITPKPRQGRPKPGCQIVLSPLRGYRPFTTRSPAFQRWVQGPKNTQAPSGTAETGMPNRSIAPSGLPALYHAKPSVETLGYSRMSLRDGGACRVGAVNPYA